MLLGGVWGGGCRMGRSRGLDEGSVLWWRGWKGAWVDY